ncbi:MAG: cytochrome-c peroxidase [Gemmatimonadota bacterium]
MIARPVTQETLALGWQLFYDPRLSVDGTISCASCHVPDAGLADPRPGSVGVGGKVGGRNAPSVISAAFNASQFWDGRSPSLEHQALGPIQNPIEMANTLEEVERRLNAMPGYREQFREVFGAERITAELVGRAIVTFERAVLSGHSPWDRCRHAYDSAAVSETVVRGAALFEGKARCTACHVGSMFSDAPFGRYHNIGVGMDAEEPDLGRHGVTQLDAHRGAFKTPILRNIAETAPYFHDGSAKTLEQVVEYYAGGGIPNPWLDPKMRALELTEEEKGHLVAFLHALTGEVPEWTRRAPRLAPGRNGQERPTARQ